MLTEDVALVLAVTSIIGVVVSSILNSLSLARKASSESKDARYAAKLEYLRQIVHAVVTARAKAEGTAASLVGSNSGAAATRAAALAEAKGALLSVADEEIINLASSINVNGNVATEAPIIDQATVRLGRLIEEHLKLRA